MKASLLSLVFLFSLQARAELKVAVVDIQKVVQNSAAGKKTKSTLEEEFNKRKKEIEKKELELKKMGEDIEKRKAVLSEDALQKRHGEFQGEMIKYREMVNRSQVEIQKRQADLSAPMLEKISKILDRLMKEKSYDLILEQGPGVLKVASSIDITDQVLKEFEKDK